MSIAQELSEKILHLTELSSVYQSDLVSVLNIKHDQRVSEAVKLLIDSHKIFRIPAIHDITKRKTYLIRLNGSHGVVSKVELNRFNILLHGNMFSPCTGCKEPECVPSICDKITEWINR